MFLQQITTPGLGCYSYIIGCPLAGVAAVVDPRRDVGIYLEIAKKNNMRITHIFDTHVHADHISGGRELAKASGADIYIHEGAPVGYEVKKLAHGEEFSFGNTHIKVLHTPGHTPNSISLVVFDFARSPEPELILTGDLLFVGDIGRPDLPGEEIMDEQVRNLYDSLHSTLGELPDGVEVYPAHGQGSLCGSGMSGKPHSTLGYERKANHRLTLKNFEDFKKSVLSHLPMRPQSFSHIISTNLKGAPIISHCGYKKKGLSVEAVAFLVAEGALVLDLRHSLAFAAAHIPGSIHVDASAPPAPNWVGTVIPPHSRLVLLLNAQEEFEARLTELRRIGYDDVEGFLEGGIDAWIDKGKAVQSIPYIGALDLQKRLAEPQPPTVIDVRTDEEKAAFSMEGALQMPFEKLLASPVCPDCPIKHKVVVCQSGYRAAIAASLLQARGCENISILAGGVAAYRAL